MTKIFNNDIKKVRLLSYDEVIVENNSNIPIIYLDMEFNTKTYEIKYIVLFKNLFGKISKHTFKSFEYAMNFINCLMY